MDSAASGFAPPDAGTTGRASSKWLCSSVNPELGK